MNEYYTSSADFIRGFGTAVCLIMKINVSKLGYSSTIIGAFYGT